MAIQASFPIWQDERLLHNYDRLDYYVTFGDETIFRGRAFRSPKNVPIEIDINRIVGDWLENGIDPEYEGVLKQENAWGQFKVWDQTTGYLLAEYGVMFNWEQEWSGESKVLSEPVNGKMDPRMRLFWSKYNVSETEVDVEGEDIYHFDADDAVSVAWDAGRATVGIRTNYSIREIVAVCPEGVRTLTYGLNWVFEVPVNRSDDPSTYTIQWYRNGVLLDQTVITVQAIPYEFECEPTETASPFGSVVDIWFNTDAPLSRITATVSEGTVSAITDGHLFVSIPQNGTGSARTITATFLINGTPVGTCAISQAYEAPWVFTASPDTIPFPGGTYVLPIDTNKPVGDITVDTPSGVTYVSKTQTGFTFSIEANTGQSRTFTLTFHWLDQTRTVTLTQAAAPYFIAQETVEMSFYGGSEFVWIDTSYNINDITFVVPQGATVSNKSQTGYNLTLPANGTESAVTYTIVYKYGNTVLGQTVATVYSNEYYSKYFTVEIGEVETSEDPGYEGPDRFLLEVHNESGTTALTMYYSVNNGAWTKYTVNRYRWEYLNITGVSVGDTIRIKSNGGIPRKSGYNNNLITINSRCTFASPQRFKVYGNIMSLVYGDSFTGKTTFPEGQFFAFFAKGGYGEEDSHLTDATNLILPATNVPDYGYRRMFTDCSLIERFPAMAPATTVGVASYAYMFDRCSNAHGQVPELPATTVKKDTYYCMFEDCVRLPSTPYLPATTLGEECYGYMFTNCSAITETQTSLPATTLVDYCYMGMYSGCVNLENAPDINGTKLFKSCLESMFNGCAKINSVKVMATSLDANAGDDYAFYMLYNASATGTFTKPASATFWTTGIRGIPTGWTVIEI